MSGIYIHIPFCSKACHYCDFHFSTALKNKDKVFSKTDNCKVEVKSSKNCKEIKGYTFFYKKDF